MEEVTTIDNLDLEDDDGMGYVEPHEPEPELEVNYSNEPPSQEDPDVIDAFLKYVGVKDKNNITFEDEQGISVKGWDDLSFEEKMNILKTSTDSPERDLNDEEIALINDIRKRNLTPSAYIQLIQNTALQLLPLAPLFTVDDLGDDDLFILDLLDRIPDISDEDVLMALEKAKENSDLYARLVAGIRNELKQQEQAYLLEQLLQQQQAMEQNYLQFAGAVNLSIHNFNKIGNLDLNLDDLDKDNIMKFILDIDDTGMSTLGKALNDPEMLVKLSWFALYGNDAFNTILNYFALEISKANISGYQRGLNDAKKGTSRVVYTKSNTLQPRSIDELYG